MALARQKLMAVTQSQGYSEVLANLIAQSVGEMKDEGKPMTVVGLAKDKQHLQNALAGATRMFACPGAQQFCLLRVTQLASVYGAGSFQKHDTKFTEQICVSCVAAPVQYRVRYTMLFRFTIVLSLPSRKDQGNGTDCVFVCFVRSASQRRYWWSGCHQLRRPSMLSL